MNTYDLVVIGGGSGGIAAALAAARGGLRVGIVERGSMLGGTAAAGGVNCWEMGAGGTSIPFDIYRRLRREHPAAVGIYSFGRHFSWQKGRNHWPHELDKVNFPGGELLIDRGRGYLDTLRRHPGRGVIPDESFKREHWHGIPFLAQSMTDTIKAMLDETGNVDVRFSTAVAKVLTRNMRVKSVTLTDGSSLHAPLWVDASGGHLCRAIGCEILQGIDPKSRFNEPSAPDQPSDRLNGVSLIYKIMPGFPKRIEPLPNNIPDDGCWWTDWFPPMNCVQYPDLGFNCNMLPTMQGREAARIGEEAAYTECKRRVKAHWHFIQTHWPEFQTYRMTWIAPILGIREGLRVVCEKMLTETDIRKGLSRQSDPDIIAIADHALDRHGEGGGCLELNEPYGIPFRCLIPKGWRNLLAAGRSAGFSSIAASSCRLTRTMMQLGQAAGTAAAIAAEYQMELPAVPVKQLRQRLRRQHVQLEWPMPTELKKYLEQEIFNS